MSFLINKENQKIVYKKIIGKKPGIIFIHGLNSDMSGNKAINIEKYAKQNKLSFIRFDCRGHGKSFGKIEDFTISDWKDDLLNIIDKIAEGPQILVVSSMGGWLMMIVSQLRGSRIIGLVGLAAAPDFTSDLFEKLPKKNQIQVKEKGITKLKKWGFNYIFKKKFFTDGKKNFVKNKKFKFRKPIILIHGSNDDVVSETVPQNFLEKTSGTNIQLRILKNSNHRLSTLKDLKNIKNALDYIINNYKFD